MIHTVKTENIPPKRITETSPPVSTFKLMRAISKPEQNEPPVPKIIKEPSIEKKAPKIEKVNNTVGNTQPDVPNTEESKVEVEKIQKADGAKAAANEESNGVGDKIKKFEKAAEDANASVGRMSRPGSVRGRSRTERLGSDSKEDLPPPATPFKDTVFELANPVPERSATVVERQQTLTRNTNVHFDLPNSNERTPAVAERQQSLTRNTKEAVHFDLPANERSVTVAERQQTLTQNAKSVKWQRSDSNSTETKKPEPRIIKPEFKPMASPVDVTIRSPSLGAKVPEQFPSHGTAFRNVASPDTARTKPEEDPKACKLKNKEKYSVSKGSSYFSRGSEEIWLVKKKDIEEIEERVLDSFRRAGGNMCMRSESMRPSSDGAQSVQSVPVAQTGFTHATMGRRARQMYTRSESLDPSWAGTRAHTLQRQTSVACTCGHDKKTRAKPVPDQARARSRSHGDDNAQAHVLDKYETLV